MGRNTAAPASIDSELLDRTNAMRALGARGDAGRTDECPAGHHMMGIEARTWAWFDQFAVVCGALQGGGALVRARTLDRRGGGGGGPGESVCGTNEAVSQLRSWRNDSYQIRSIELTCQNIITGRTHVLGLRGAQTSTYLATPVTIFLGVDDTGDKNLDDSAEAKAQGATRIERGRNAFSKGEALARQRGWPFNWRLIELPGVGHSAGKMFSSDRAIEAMRQ
jgi:hypothetical protein